MTTKPTTRVLHPGGRKEGDSSDQKTWRSRLLIGALVTFLISGLGGVLVQRFLARARISVAVLSVGFQGDNDEIIEVPQSLVDLSHRSKWDEPLEHYESFRSLVRRGDRAAQDFANLELSATLSRAWLREAQATLSTGTVSEAALTGFPLFLNKSVGAILFGAIKIGEMPDPPVNLETIRSSRLLASLQRIPVGWQFRKGNLVTDFVVRPRAEEATSPDTQQMNGLELLARSVATGNALNLRAYIQFFLTTEAIEAKLIRGIKDNIEPLILENCHLAIAASLQNEGQLPAILKPYFGVRLLGGRVGDIDMVASAREVNALETAKEVLREANNEPNDSESRAGSSVKVEEFLSKTGAAQYQTASPGTATKINLVTVDKLGSNGVLIRRLFTNGALGCSVVGIKPDGSAVWSSPGVFGNSIPQPRRDEILDILKTSR